MGGFFGVVSKSDCINDLFYGTDYHSHLGNLRGGLMTWGKQGIKRYIHDITGAPFRAKFEEDLKDLSGANQGIGCISDTGDQPLIVRSHLGTFGVTMVGCINNLEELAKEACSDNTVHFSEITNDGINPNEMAASIVASGETLNDGILKLHESIDGSCSMLLLTDKGIIAIRDKYGRTPVVIGQKPGAFSATLETTALYNLGFTPVHELGPGEAVYVDADGYKTIVEPGKKMQFCTFFWIYFGFPASTYSGKNVETTRYICGEKLSRADRERGADMNLDAVVGVPDSGNAHALGYAHNSGIPYKRAFVKYTPTWARSFIPRDQANRAHVASMKLIPIDELIRDKKLLFCEDSVVRGTQLGNTFDRLSKCGAKEVHVRSACPPILYNCKYLNFSRSNGLMGLAGRRAIAKVEGHVFSSDKAAEEKWLESLDLTDYLNPETEKYRKMVDAIRDELRLTSLHFQTLDDLVDAIGLPKDMLCTYCWDGCGTCKCHCSDKKD